MEQAFTATIPVGYPALGMKAEPSGGIGANLIALREQQRWTQEEAAKRGGFKQAVLSKWETGRTTPQPASLLRLARLYGRALDDLLAGVDAAYDSMRGADLIRHPDGYKSAARGATDESAIGRKIRRRLARLETVLASSVDELRAIGREIDQPTAAQRPRSRRG